MVVVTPSAGFFRFLSAEHLKAGVLTEVMNRLRLLKIPVRKSQFGNQWTVFFRKTPSIGSILAPLPTALSPDLRGGDYRLVFKGSRDALSRVLDRSDPHPRIAV